MGWACVDEQLWVRLFKGMAWRPKQQRPLLWVETNWLKTWISYICYLCQGKAKRKRTNIFIFQGVKRQEAAAGNESLVHRIFCVHPKKDFLLLNCQHFIGAWELQLHGQCLANVRKALPYDIKNKKQFLRLKLFFL